MLVVYKQIGSCEVSNLAQMSPMFGKPKRHAGDSTSSYYSQSWLCRSTHVHIINQLSAAYREYLLLIV